MVVCEDMFYEWLEKSLVGLVDVDGVFFGLCIYGGEMYGFSGVFVED